MRTRNYNFDIDKHSLIKPVVIIRSGDHDIDTIRVTLSEQGDPVDLTKATVTFMGTTPAGNKIIDDAHVKIVDATTGIFEYTFPSAAGSSVGEYQEAYFSIIMGNGQTSTMNFRIQVLSGVDISAPAASDYVTNFNTMVVNLNSAYDSTIAATNTKMAAAVSSVATSAAAVLDSALANVTTVNSQANNASSTANMAVSMASSVASAVASQASYINSVASSAAADVNRALDKINNMSVGGRNLLLDTGRSFTGIGSNQDNGSFDAQNGKYYLAGGKKVSDLYKQYGPSRYLTLSFDWVADGSTISGHFKPQWYGTPWNSGITDDIYPSANNKSGHYKTSISLSSDGYSTGEATSIQFRQDYLQGNITIKNLKLEAGNIATDWTPAPEDTVATANSLTTRPATFTDFNTVAKDVLSYTGNWQITSSAGVTNGPYGNVTRGALVVIQTSGWPDSGSILFYDLNGPQDIYAGIVAGGVLVWTKVAKDSNVVHKTDTETIPGDKTFTGKVMIGGGNYQTTVSATTNYFGSTISFIRIGNQVTFTSSISSFTSDVAIGLASGVIPVGFRPALQQNVNANGQAKGGAFFSFDGGGAIYSYTTYPSGTQPRVSGTYITTDAWPNN